MCFPVCDFSKNKICCVPFKERVGDLVKIGVKQKQKIKESNKQVKYMMGNPQTNITKQHVCANNARKEDKASGRTPITQSAAMKQK
jgi:hypothetical protein